MFTDDPLEIWLMRDEVKHEARLATRRDESLAEIQAALDQLQEMLDHPPAKGANLLNSRVYGLGVWSMTYLPAEMVTRAEDLYRRVYVTGGTGSTYVQEGLLFIIGASCQPASIPFWLETLELSRPRDSFTTKRRVLALAALAYLAAHECQEAEEALARCAQHANSDIRAQAVIYWGAFYRALQQALSQSVAEAMLAIALNDATFGPRFQARQILRENNLPVPLDNPRGVYACKVKFKWTKAIYRTIELRSDQTLEDLHLAIQHAIKWDNDHLYSFYLNGVKYDERYRYSCPNEEDRPPWTEEAVIGQLGLVKRHKFLYYFDYGDSHEFEIEVTDIRPEAEQGEYPRVVESQGAAPEQYDRGEW
jgi:hypothetical protein